MPKEAFYDYMLTGNPKGIAEFGKGQTYAEHNPYNFFYQRELARNKEAGLPTSQQIQYGQVRSLGPGGPMGTTAFSPQTSSPALGQAPTLMTGTPPSMPTGGAPPSMYIPYADAMSGLKQQYGSDPYTISGYGAPQASTWDQFQKEWGQTYNQGGRVSLSNGGLAKILGV